MNRILVPVDFSEHDDKVLQYAAVLAQKERAHLFVLHVYDPADAGSRKKKKQPVPDPAIREERFARLEAIRSRIAATQNLEVSTLLFTGPVTVSILQAAKDYRADLILMRASGNDQAPAGKAGGKSAAILRASPVPVLIIPNEYQWVLPQKMIVAINNEKENLGMLKPVFDMSHHFGAELSIFIFSKEEQEGSHIMADTQTIYNIRESLKRQYPHAAIGIVHLSGKDFTTTIKEYISKKKFDLLALITHHKSWIHHLGGKSMTQEIAGASAIPLLSINPE